MRVKAIARGYDNLTLREEDEEFDFDVDPEVFKLPVGKGRPTWFVPVEAEAKAEKPKRGKDE